MSKLIEGLKYSETHEWVKVEGDLATSSDLVCPVTGTVVERNDELEDQPELINSDPYTNWIIKVKMSDPSELDELMDAEGYKAMTEK